MNKIRVLSILLISLAFFTNGSAQGEGEKLFSETCVACHTIGKGKIVGPDLEGINQKRDQEWLISFIRSSGKMIRKGDSLAEALFEEHNRIPMPDNNYSNSEIVSILDYIRESSSPAITEQPESGKTDSVEHGTFTAEEGSRQDSFRAETRSGTAVKQPAVSDYPDAHLQKGKALFYGYEAFAEGVSPCIACHDIRDKSVITGGTLSLDLTGAYNKLGPAGINAILSNPPFPVMKTALSGIVLTDEEKESLTAYLHLANDQFSDNPKRGIENLSILLFSILIAFFITLLLYMAYNNRKIPSHK